jgi:hypothetical protein
MWIRWPIFPARLYCGYCSAIAEDGSGTAVPAQASLPDRIALGVLTRPVTRELVEDMLALTGRAEQRKGCLALRAPVHHYAIRKPMAEAADRPSSSSAPP